MHRVLLVLDSEDLSAVLHKKLSENFEVKICEAATATETIDHYRPDALILDLFLVSLKRLSVISLPVESL